MNDLFPRVSTLLATSLALLISLGAGCSGPRERRIPVQEGMILQITSAQRHVPGDATALQIRWFGTSCYALELGDLSLLIDPFVSNGHVYPWRDEPDPAEIERVFKRLALAPRAIFVNHAHNDHFLDAHEALRIWPTATLYGGKTAANILAGYGLRDRARDVAQVTSGAVESPQASVRFEAFPTQHTPHFKSGWTFLGGKVEAPLQQAPSFWCYKAGEAFNFLFEFRSKVRPGRPLRVFMLSSPHSEAHPLPDPKQTPIDVLVILVPSAKNVGGDYPAAWIQKLEPRIVLLSHYNDFFSRRSENPPPGKTLFAADLVGFLLDAQRGAATYARFERIVVPAVADPSKPAADTVVRVPLPAE